MCISTLSGKVTSCNLIKPAENFLPLISASGGNKNERVVIVLVVIGVHESVI